MSGDIEKYPRFSRPGDIMLEIPGNVTALNKINSWNIPKSTVPGFYQIDLETGQILRRFFDNPTLPIYIGGSMTSGNTTTSPVAKIVTNNCGMYWIKTESGSLYALHGKDRHIAKITSSMRNSMIGKVLGLGDK